VPSALPATPALESSPTSIKGDDVEAAVAPGRMLKSAYISHGVIPTLMDLFFEFPDNDFLHYLVYDVVQQVLSGRLQPGLNRDLVLEMICKGDLVTRVLKTAVTGEIDK
jgi:SIT4-associating protein SAP185/190